MYRIAALFVFFAIMALPLPAGAQPIPREPSVRERMASLSLDELFTRLGSTDAPAAAKAYEAEIQKRFHQSGSDTADLLLSWAIEAMNGDDNALALDVLDQLVLLKPDFAEAWNKRATVYFAMKDFGGSLSDIRRTLALEPRHFGALSGLAIILEDLGHEDEALSAYRRALELNPQMDSVREALQKLEAKAAARAI